MTNENGKLGVDNVKRVLAFLASSVYATVTIDKNLDGKVDTAEKINYGSTLVMGGMAMVPHLGPARDEVRRGELSEDEFNELVEYTVSLDFLPPKKDHVEEYVRRVINWINYNRKFVQYSIDFFKPEEVEMASATTSKAKAAKATPSKAAAAKK